MSLEVSNMLTSNLEKRNIKKVLSMSEKLDLKLFLWNAPSPFPAVLEWDQDECIYVDWRSGPEDRLSPQSSLGAPMFSLELREQAQLEAQPQTMGPSQSRAPALQANFVLVGRRGVPRADLCPVIYPFLLTRLQTASLSAFQASG